MKRICIALLCLLLTLSFTGCPSTDAPVAELPDAEPSVAEPSLDLLREQAALNEFLTPFEVSWLDNYDTIPTSAQVYFAFGYCKYYLHDQMVIKYDDAPYEYGSYAFHEDLIAEVVAKYFGVTLEHPTSDYQYDQYFCYTTDGFYHISPADGAYFGYVSIADEVTLRDDGLYDVHFSSYEIDADHFWEASEDGSEFYAHTPQDAAEDPLLSFRFTGTAVVEYVAEGQYYLVGYHVDK